MTSTEIPSLRVNHNLTAAATPASKPANITCGDVVGLFGMIAKQLSASTQRILVTAY